MFKLLIFLWLVFFFNFFSVQSQNLQRCGIDNVCVRLKNGEFIVRYDLLSTSNKKSYFVSLYALNGMGDSVVARSVMGDCGLNMRVGGNKSMVWNFSNDSFIVDSLTTIRVVAVEQEGRQVSVVKAASLSLLFSGWGTYSLTANKKYLFFGGVACVSTISGLFLHNKAVQTYHDYTQSLKLHTRKNLKSDWKLYRSISNVFFAASAVIIVTDLSIFFVRARKVRALNNKLLERVSFFPVCDYEKHQAGFALSLRF